MITAPAPAAWIAWLDARRTEDGVDTDAATFRLQARWRLRIQERSAVRAAARDAQLGPAALVVQRWWGRRLEMRAAKTELEELALARTTLGIMTSSSSFSSSSPSSGLDDGASRTPTPPTVRQHQSSPKKKPVLPSPSGVSSAEEGKKVTEDEMTGSGTSADHEGKEKVLDKDEKPAVLSENNVLGAAPSASLSQAQAEALVASALTSSASSTFVPSSSSPSADPHQAATRTTRRTFEERMAAANNIGSSGLAEDEDSSKGSSSAKFAMAPPPPKGSAMPRNSGPKARPAQLGVQLRPAGDCSAGAGQIRIPTPPSVTARMSSEVVGSSSSTSAAIPALGGKETAGLLETAQPPSPRFGSGVPGVFHTGPSSCKPQKQELEAGAASPPKPSPPPKVLVTGMDEEETRSLRAAMVQKFFAGCSAPPRESSWERKTQNPPDHRKDGGGGLLSGRFRPGVGSRRSAPEDPFGGDGSTSVKTPATASSTRPLDRRLQSQRPSRTPPTGAEEREEVLGRGTQRTTGPILGSPAGGRGERAMPVGGYGGGGSGGSGGVVVGRCEKSAERVIRRVGDDDSLSPVGKHTKLPSLASSILTKTSPPRPSASAAALRSGNTAPPWSIPTARSPPA